MNLCEIIADLNNPGVMQVALVGFAVAWIIVGLCILEEI